MTNIYNLKGGMPPKKDKALAALEIDIKYHSEGGISVCTIKESDLEALAESHTDLSRLNIVYGVVALIAIVGFLLVTTGLLYMLTEKYDSPNYEAETNYEQQ